MLPFSSKYPAYALLPATLLCASVLSLPVQAQEAPFAGLAGSWSGNGTVTLASGAKERIRCRATYAVAGGGNTLQQNLRCASDSYQFDLTSNVTHQGGNLSGTWSETTRGASGSLSGRVTPTQYQVTATGPGFNANLAVATRANQQSVQIRSGGTQISDVSITMSKR
jgi:hypothetical protein